MPKRKRYWSCLWSVRGKAAPDCQRRIEAGPDDFKTLRAAGWRQVENGPSRRIFFKCPACVRLEWSKSTPTPAYAAADRVVIVSGQSLIGRRGRRGTVVAPRDTWCPTLLPSARVDVAVDDFGTLAFDKKDLRALTLIERISELEKLAHDH